MAKKKRGKVTRRSSKRSSVKKSSVNVSHNRVKVARKNFFLFLILSAISTAFYKFSTSILFLNLFGILATIFGFLSLAFLIAFVVLKLLNKNKH